MVVVLVVVVAGEALVLPQQHLELAPHIPAVVVAAVTLEQVALVAVLVQRVAVMVQALQPTVVRSVGKVTARLLPRTVGQEVAEVQYLVNSTTVAVLVVPVERDSFKLLIGLDRR